MTSACAWRHLPEAFSVSPVTAHRRFAAWTEAGLWRRLHRAVLDELGARGEWTGPRRSSTRPRSGRKGGALTGPNPVDRSNKGSKLHVLSEAQGITLAVAISAANTNNILALKPLIRAISPVRSLTGPRRRRPVKLRADKSTSLPRTWPGSASADSSRASHARGSNRANGSAAIAGRSNGRLPGCSATAALSLFSSATD
ncbi:IS5/IS1182 family transposase, partial [Streptomyces pathocidini]